MFTFFFFIKKTPSTKPVERIVCFFVRQNLKARKKMAFEANLLLSVLRSLVLLVLEHCYSCCGSQKNGCDCFNQIGIGTFSLYLIEMLDLFDRQPPCVSLIEVQTLKQMNVSNQ